MATQCKQENRSGDGASSWQRPRRNKETQGNNAKQGNPSKPVIDVWEMCGSRCGAGSWERPGRNKENKEKQGKTRKNKEKQGNPSRPVIDGWETCGKR